MKISKGIEFFRPQKISPRKEKLIRSLKVGSVVFLIFYSLLVTAFLSLWIYWRQETRIINQKIVAQKQKIDRLKKIESLQVVLKQRLAFLNKLFSQEKTDYGQILASLEEIIPSGLVLTKIEISEEGEIDLVGTAENAVALSNFLVKLAEEEKGFFSKVTLSSAVRQEDGGYDFSLSLKTNEV